MPQPPQRRYDEQARKVPAQKQQLEKVISPLVALIATSLTAKAGLLTIVSRAPRVLSSIGSFSLHRPADQTARISNNRRPAPVEVHKKTPAQAGAYNFSNKCEAF